MNTINEIGNKFGKLTVKERGESDRYGVSWICDCECGRQVIRRGVYLRHHINNKEASCRFCKINGPERKVKGEVLLKQYRAYRNSTSAQIKGFELTLEEFEIISRKPCYYCEEPPVYRRYKYDSAAKGPLYTEDYLSGVDRVDNEKGYILENCVPACPKCNHMKSTLTKKEFLEHIQKILSVHCK